MICLCDEHFSVISVIIHLCINVLLQAKKAEEKIALKTIQIFEKDSEHIIVKYVKYKS